MRAFDFDQISDEVYEALQVVYPTAHIYDMGGMDRMAPEVFTGIELPAVTYSLRLELNLERVTDYLTTKDTTNMQGTVEEMVPYDLAITVGCHSDLRREAQAMALQAHRAFGRAPCVGSIGCYLEDTYNTDFFQETGVFSFYFRWVGWLRLSGRAETAPLVETVRHRLEMRLRPGGEAEVEEVEYNASEEG